MFNHDNWPSVSTGMSPELKSHIGENFSRKKQAEEAMIETVEHVKQITQTVNTIKEEVIDIEKEVSRERTSREKGDKLSTKIAVWSIIVAVLSLIVAIIAIVV